jgi:hypothetical protein
VQQVLETPEIGNLLLLVVAAVLLDAGTEEGFLEVELMLEDSEDDQESDLQSCERQQHQLSRPCRVLQPGSQL